jgi:hypothetical protein
MKFSVQIELEVSYGPDCSKDEIVAALKNNLISNGVGVGVNTRYEISSVRLITGARPIVKVKP